MSSEDSLITELVAQCRQASNEELERILGHVAKATFSSRPLPVDERLWGILYQGEVLDQESRLPSVEGHLLKRVYVERQWPAGTTVEEYVTDLHRAARHPQARIWTYWHAGSPCVGILSPSHVENVPEPQAYIVVVYDARFSRIRTGFQASGVDSIPAPSVYRQKLVRQR
jgi:hypothetical protein